MNLDFSDPSHEALEIITGYDSRPMVAKTFEIYLDDDRYSVPTLHLVIVENSEKALAIATRLIDDCPHHLGAEICLDGERVAGLGSFALRRLPPDVPSREPEILD